MGIHLAQLTDDAVRRDDRHVAAEAVGRSLVKIEDTRLVAAAGADDLGGQCFVYIFFLEVHEGLQAPALAGIFKQSGLLKAQPVDGFLKVLIMLANMAQVDVVLPETGYAEAGRMDEPLRR